MTIFWKIISWFATFGCLVAGLFTGTNNSDFTFNYKRDVKSVAFYQNDFETALPQTDMYSIICNHLNGESKDGKEKKLIVIGYDGCRADNLTLCSSKNDSGILTLLDNGGKAVISYCGGVNYPKINTQDTSTAPGWCSMLTGQWADVHGIYENSIVKHGNYTALTTLVENETIDSSAFYVSWGGHFSNDDSTYFEEKQYIEKNNINAKFLRSETGDEGTLTNVLTDIKQENCSDFIFSIFEFCDEAGHDTGFCKNNEEQVQAFKDSEKTACEIIAAIKSRPTYEKEDWMIIITSDHGGYNNWHGGPTMQERYTFIVSNKQF